MNIQDIKYIEKRIKEIYLNKDIEIITSKDEEFYSICIIIDGWKYSYVILKECDSVGEVINYIVKDLKKEGDRMKILYKLKELSDILLKKYNSIMKIEFSQYDNTIYHIIITNNKMSCRIECNIEDDIDIDMIIKRYKSLIIQEVIQ